MHSNGLIKRLTAELESNADFEFQKNSLKFFKEKVKVRGVRTQVVRRISKKFFEEVKQKEKPEIFDLCQEFLKTGFCEDSVVAFDWAYRCRKQFKRSDFEVFECWLKNHVSNWGSCDNFCTHAFGELLLQFPELLDETKKWTRSKNRWLRRASAVVLIYPVKHSKGMKTHSVFLETVFETCDFLLPDKDDLVQKGYGWLLKETANHHPSEVFSYVMPRKNEMPRTAFRYALEKFPENLRKKAMQEQVAV